MKVAPMRCFPMRSLALIMFFVLGSLLSAAGEATEELRVATFRCDITPPLGQPMFFCDLLRTVEQPLLAKGIVLDAGKQRYVLCAVDWCELCDNSYETWRHKIAAAAGVDPDHVAVQCVHVHTAPLVDSDAQKLLAGIGAQKLHLDPKALEAIEQRLVASVKESLAHFKSFDRIGTGQAKVDRVASSRRPRDATGKIRIRLSTCRDPAVRALPEGEIDPYLKTITLAQGEKPLVRLHVYATHPQTHYGDGRASSDIVGDAREAIELKEHVFQIYFTGCAGDIGVGKYNDGSPKCRKELGARLLAGMEAAVAATTFAPIGPIQWRSDPVVFPRRDDPGFSMADALKRMNDEKTIPFERVYKGAVRAAFHQRAGEPILLSSLAIGNVYMLFLPGEPMIAFQFFAQKLRPADFVAVAGYSDCGTGYICPEQAYREGGYEVTDANVTPESEALLKKAITTLLGVP